MKALRMTDAEYLAQQQKTRKTLATQQAPPNKNKYRNQPVELMGKKFDSKREAGRYMGLMAQQHAGMITALKHHVSYPILVNNQPICEYEADFIYKDKNGFVVVEDVKSSITRKNPVYRLKAKLMFACYGIVIIEV